MSRPICKQEVVLSDNGDNKTTVLMTPRQEAFFRIMLEAGGFIVDRNSLMLNLGMTGGSLRVVKYEVANLVQGFYEIKAIPNGGYQMNRV